jgi:hypothetical protein
VILVDSDVLIEHLRGNATGFDLPVTGVPLRA